MKEVFYQVKLHPFAVTLYLIYMGLWLFAYIINFQSAKQLQTLNHGPRCDFSFGLYILLLFIAVPYAVILLLISGFSKNCQAFYLAMFFMVLAPVILLYVWTH